MANRLINVGTAANSKNGDTLRNAFIKINENFTELYNSVELLGGISTGGTIQATLQGDLVSETGAVLVSSTTGKVSPSAMPTNIPLVYRSRAVFKNDGSLESVNNLPTGWAVEVTGNLVTINHRVGRPPSVITYWGHSKDSDELRMRLPTAGYQAKLILSGEQAVHFPFSLNLNSAVTGADIGEYAIIVVTF